MSDIAIKVENLGKRYQIGQAKSGDFRQSFDHWIDKLRGRTNGHAVAGSVEEFWALKDVNFEIKKGEAVGIIGRNGAGKSTLLKILSRITEPSKGRFEINGRVSSLLEVGTGFHPELSGRENIYLNGTILGMKRSEIRAKFDEIVSFSGVEKFIDTPVKHYSSGMKVRLAFSVAAHLEPEILIIDEVLAVGDAEFQKKCLGKMDEVAGHGRTVLFVSHNLDALRMLCKNSILLKHGQIVDRGDSSRLIMNYLLDDEIQKLKNSIKNKVIKDSFVINDFSLANESIKQFDDLEYILKISPCQNNKILQVAVLIFDSLDKRISVVDLRSRDLFSVTTKKCSIEIRGTIRTLNLLPGTYYFGLYISSLNFSGNILKMVKLYVIENENEVISYPKEVRGIIDFKHTYELYIDHELYK